MTVPLSDVSAPYAATLDAIDGIQPVSWRWQVLHLLRDDARDLLRDDARDPFADGAAPTDAELAAAQADATNWGAPPDD